MTPTSGAASFIARTALQTRPLSLSASRPLASFFAASMKGNTAIAGMPSFCARLAAFGGGAHGETRCARHGGDGNLVLAAVVHDERPDEIVGAQAMFACEAAHPIALAQDGADGMMGTFQCSSCDSFATNAFRCARRASVTRDHDLSYFRLWRYPISGSTPAQFNRDDARLRDADKQVFESAVASIRDEGRYRVFADIMRERGRFPHATLRARRRLDARHRRVVLERLSGPGPKPRSDRCGACGVGQGGRRRRRHAQYFRHDQLSRRSRARTRFTARQGSGAAVHVGLCVERCDAVDAGEALSRTSGFSRTRKTTPR